MAGLIGRGDAAEAQRLVKLGGEDGTLFRSGNHGGGQEEALEQAGHEPQIGTYLLAKAGGGEPEGAAADALFRAADIAADGGQAAAGVLDEGADHHVGPYIGGLHGFYKFAIAVVHHNGHIRLALLAEGNELADLSHGEREPGGVALGPLDGDELGFLVDGSLDARIVKASVGEQIYLPVADAVLRQGTGTLADADDLLQGIVGGSHRGQQLVAGQQIGTEGYSQGVGAAGDLRPDQGSLGVEYVGVDLFQGVPAQVIVAVAGGSGKAGGADPILPHGIEHLGLVVFGDGINGGEPVLQTLNGLFSVGVNSGRYAHFHVHIDQLFQEIHSFPYF